MNLTNDFKRVLSGMLSVAMTATLVQSFPAIAEDAQTTKYPYAVFASSDIEGAITVNAGNFCVNGNVATNGTIVASGNMNINGTKTENVGEDMIYIFDKIDSAYFSESNVNEYSDDYILEEMNINITTPTEIMGEATLTGNININTALKAFENVNLYGEVKNTNDSVIFSKYGDIVIDSQNVNLNGLVYAPFGDVVVTAQNLNLNNVVIIADTITFNCPNVNANYSSSVAEFVGTVSEPLDIPYDEWQYMKDENENDFPDFFEDFDNWSKLKDTDGDKLPDCVEQYIGSDSTLADTDGDALDDFYELFVTYTEPAKDDTDDNGILDCDEDFDKDDLSNLEEYLASTSPWDDDTDSDILKDGEEIDTYSTDPLKPDTDDDGLEDSDEIHLGTDPVNPDTDSDGILDGDEKFYQTYTHIVENEDCVVSEVIVSLEGTGNLQKNTTVKSVMNKDVLCTNVAGLVGEPFNIETSSQFDTATITFKIDKSKLGDTEFDNLMFLWYDEENDEFVELETILDEQNSTVSVVTTHFSKYMIVDRQAWYDAWALEFNYGRQFDNSGAPLRIYNTVLAIDCSGSMSDYDRNGTIRKEAATGFINIMNPNDKTALMFFDSTVDRFHVLTSDKDALLRLLDRMYTSGGTDFDVALQSAIALLEDEVGKPNVINRIIFMTDGQDSLSTNVLDVAKDNNIMIYTIGFSTNTSDSNLQYYADYTGGEFYKAYNADELIEIYENIALSSDFDTTDADGDGLYDAVEAAGIRLHNGDIINTDPTDPDSDNDGLLDGEEIDPTPLYSEKEDNGWLGIKKLLGTNTVQGYYFDMYSDPNNPDTDGDLDLDADDSYPTDYQLNGVLINNINKLFMLANMYSYENSLSSDKYETDVETWLIFMFLRQFNSGYINSNWSGTGNAIDEDFVDYVAKHNIVLYEYFEGTTTFYANSKGELGDLYHMAATLNGYIFKSGFDYGYAFGIMPEYHIDNLSGWAGDLQTAMNNAMAITDMTKDYDLFKDVMSNLIGYDPNTDDIYNEYQHSFDIDDVYADTDAYNIYVKLCEGESIHNVLLDYYDTGYLKRFSSFTGNANEEDIGELVYTYTSNKYMNMIQWPLFDYDFNEVQSEAARDAFVEFLMEKIANE